MNIIMQSHIDQGISVEWLQSLPGSDVFCVSIHQHPEPGLSMCALTDTGIHWQRSKHGSMQRMTSTIKPVLTNNVVVVQMHIYPGDKHTVVSRAYFGNTPVPTEPFSPSMSEEECIQWCNDNPSSFWAMHAWTV